MNLFCSLPSVLQLNDLINRLKVTTSVKENQVHFLKICSIMKSPSFNMGGRPLHPLSQNPDKEH